MFDIHSKTFTELVCYLEAAKGLVGEPMLLPTLLEEINAHFREEWVEQCRQEIFDVEKSTKMRKGLADLQVEETVPDWRTIDLIEITRSINSVLAKLAFGSLLCQTSLQLLKFLSDTTKSFQRSGVGA